MTYAAETTVPVGRTRDEIERILTQWGADQFAYGWDQERAMVSFRARGRLVRFVLTMPDPADRAFTRTPSGKQARDAQSARREWEKACRSRWRALALVIKAKVEAIEAGISEFEREFLANIVLPDQSTVGDWVAPQIEAAYTSGSMPAALPALESGR